MHKKIGILSSIIGFLAITSLGLAQDSTGAIMHKNIYRKSWHAGFLMHTNGLGGNFRIEKFKTAFLKQFWTIEAYHIKDKKEQKSFGASQDESKSYIYGKLNHLYVVKGGVGREKVMFDKEVIRGVQISSVFNINAAFAFLKPVYLEIYKQQPDNSTIIVSEKYDPEKHPQSSIAGKASWAQGFSNLQVVPGLSLKLGLNFEFAPQHEKIKAIEVGANIDGFFGKVPIMAQQNDQYIFTNLYINFQFGRKSYL
jgi:hypothetical protein